MSAWCEKFLTLTEARDMQESVRKSIVSAFDADNPFHAIVDTSYSMSIAEFMLYLEKIAKEPKYYSMFRKGLQFKISNSRPPKLASQTNF